jgi:signal transduction histidine kinase
MRRLPIESTRAVLAFAITRVALTVGAFLAVLVLSIPDRGDMLILLGAAALPWTLLVLVISIVEPDTAMNPIVALGDFALLLLFQTVSPESYGAVRFAALFLIAVHAHFQGELRGLMVAALGSAALVVPGAVRGGGPTSGSLLAFYETVFVLMSLATGALVGRLRTTESASRLQARRLSRRTIQAETEVRRKVAEAIHDGPVQDLIGLDMILAAARQAASDGDAARAGMLVDEARDLTTRNVGVLRDEIVDLGPYAFEELSYSGAVENCLAIWKRRYGLEVLATIEPLDLTAETAGDLFRITQEAVVNAGRHAEAEAVSISLRHVGNELELRVTDNGKGFADGQPLSAIQPGHLGLASMRERAEMMAGTLDIETSSRGTRVLVRAPL